MINTGKPDDGADDEADMTLPSSDVKLLEKLKSDRKNRSEPFNLKAVKDAL